MRAVTRLHSAKHMDCRKIGAGKCAVMNYFRDVCTRESEHAGKVRETAGAIGDQRIEAVNASVCSEPTLNDAAVREGIEQADRGLFIEEEEMDERFERMLRS